MKIVKVRPALKRRVELGEEERMGSEVGVVEKFVDFSRISGAINVVKSFLVDGHVVFTICCGVAVGRQE